MVVPANAKYQIINEMLQRDDNMLNVTGYAMQPVFRDLAIIIILQQRVFDFREKNKTVKIF
jgi:hypothetical protein